MTKRGIEMKKPIFAILIIGLILATAFAGCIGEKGERLKPTAAKFKVNVSEYGATGNGKTLDTSAINAAIEACAESGGGIVYFPPGTYLSGSIHMKSKVTLCLDSGSTILGSPNHEDYGKIKTSYWTKDNRYFGNHEPYEALIYGEGLHDIGIVGRGTIDGQGRFWWKSAPKNTVGWDKIRPRGIEFIQCKNILRQGITLTNPGAWTIHNLGCDTVKIDGINIINPPDSPNTDGINHDSCRNVHISNCHLDVGDDCITLKAEGGDPCEDITITNCITIHGHGGVVIGSEMSGDVRNIVVENCVFHETDRGIRIKTARGRGGKVENITCSDIVMKNVREPLRINTAYGYGTIDQTKFLNPWTPLCRNIHVNNSIIVNSGQLSMIGLLEKPLEEIVLNNIKIIDASVEKDMSICRNINDLELHNIQAGFAGPTKKYILNFANIDSLELDNFKFKNVDDVSIPVNFTNVKNMSINNSPSISLATMRYEKPTVLKKEVLSNELNSVTVPVKNIGKEGLAKIDLYIDKNLYDTKYIWMKPNESKDILFSDIKLYALGKHEIKVGEFMDKVNVKSTPPVFVYSDLEVNPVSMIKGLSSSVLVHSSVPSLNERQCIDITIQNIGSCAHTESVKLYIDGLEINAIDITLKPGEIKRVRLTNNYMFSTSGIHKIALGNLSQDIYVWNKFGKFTCKDLEISKSKVISGGTVTIKVLITDTGYGKEYNNMHKGSKINLYIDGKLTDCAWAKVEKGKEEIVKFDLRFDEVGEHIISVGESTATATVKPRPLVATFKYTSKIKVLTNEDAKVPLSLSFT
jgi:hypothetical protein